MKSSKHEQVFIQYANMECELIAASDWIKYFTKLYENCQFISCKLKSKKGLIHTRLKIKDSSERNISLTFFQNPKSNLFTIHASKAPIFLYPAVHQFIARIFNIILHKSGGFVLHASSILIEKKAIIFSGKSGSGKSTIVDLIKKRIPGSVILSDNSAFIFKKNNEFVIYPSPFLETNRFDIFKQHIHNNSPYIVKAVFSPSHGERHKINNLSFSDKLSLIRMNSHIPFMPNTLFSQKEIKEFGKLIFSFIDNVDIYQIKLRPDSDFIPILIKKITEDG